MSIVGEEKLSFFTYFVFITESWKKIIKLSRGEGKIFLFRDVCGKIMIEILFLLNITLSQLNTKQQKELSQSS